MLIKINEQNHDYQYLPPRQFILMSTQQICKISVSPLDDQYGESPFARKITQPTSQNNIFGKKDDLKKSLHIFRKRKQQKSKEKQKQKNRLNTTQFANPFIKMKVESTNNRGSNKLTLACIDLGMDYHNPESAPVTTKRSTRQSFTIKQKFKNQSEIKDKKNSIEEKDSTKSIIKKSKQYLNFPLHQTEILLSKLRAKIMKSKKEPHQSTSAVLRKRSLVAPRSLNLLKIEPEIHTLWPFTPYKTIRQRVARGNMMIYSQQLKQLKIPALKI